MKKILIVDDLDYMYEIWRDLFEVNKLEIEIIKALSIKEAEEAFNNNSDLNAVVVDACVPGYEPNTMDLIRKMRKSFFGPIIAISDEDDFNDILMKAGCNCQTRKWTLPQKIKEVLCL